MKKTYINPELVVVKIATQQILAASNPDGFADVIDQVGGDGGDVLARDMDFEDDEDFDFDEEEGF